MDSDDLPDLEDANAIFTSLDFSNNLHRPAPMCHVTKKIISISDKQTRMPPKYLTWAITVRPQSGITNDQIAGIIQWIERTCDYYHVITDGKFRPQSEITTGGD